MLSEVVGAERKPNMVLTIETHNDPANISNKAWVTTKKDGDFTIKVSDRDETMDTIRIRRKSTDENITEIVI